MYEEEFYAAIKMVSGEEVFSKVCPCEEKDRIILILDNPVFNGNYHNSSVWNDST